MQQMDAYEHHVTCRASFCSVVTTSCAILASSPDVGSSTNITDGFT